MSDALQFIRWHNLYLSELNARSQINLSSTGIFIWVFTLCNSQTITLLTIFQLVHDLQRCLFLAAPLVLQFEQMLHREWTRHFSITILIDLLVSFTGHFILCFDYVISLTKLSSRNKPSEISSLSKPSKMLPISHSNSQSLSRIIAFHVIFLSLLLDSKLFMVESVVIFSQ